MYTTIDELVAVAETIAERNHDHTVRVSRIGFDPATGMVHIPADLVDASMSLHLEEHASNQLCQKASPALYGAGSNRQLPCKHYWELRERFPHLWAAEFSEFVAQPILNHDKSWLIRGNDTAIRAVLSDRYAVIDNLDLLEMMSEVLRNENYTLARPSLTRDTMIVTTVLKEIPSNPWLPDGNYGLGFKARNDEIGKGSCQVFPVLQRTSCSNSIVPIYNENGESMGVRLVHVGDAFLKKTLVAGAIAEVLPHAEATLARYIEARSEAIPRLSNLISRLGERFKWPEELKMAVTLGTEGQETQAGLVNGITRAAQTLEDPDDQLRMEQLGGQMLFTAAARLVEMSEKQVPIPAFSLY